jgi:hypothetical protein
LAVARHIAALRHGFSPAAPCSGKRRVVAARPAGRSATRPRVTVRFNAEEHP